jgi:glycosyltransferase involved in cell wall biosynthesis
VRNDIAALTGLSRRRIVVIPNPVVTAELLDQARCPLDHPWFHPSAPPVVMGVGRLTRQKDFPTLLHAFAAVRASRPCRLVILGEGRDRPALAALAAALNINLDVDLPGFIPNPYAYMARAAAFVLSSAWEGSPNVLTEALALGTPVVATDCPSGPREILQHGRLGRLVPIGRPEAMADAIAAILDNPPLRKACREVLVRYAAPASAQRYLAVMSGAG